MAGLSIVLELLVNAIIIMFVMIAAYGHVLLLKALLPDAWLRRKPAPGWWRRRSGAQAGARG